MFRPVTVDKILSCPPATKQLSTSLPMVNSVINQDTGASLEYCQLTQDETTFQFWNKATINECEHLAQGVGGHIEVSNTVLLIPHDAPCPPHCGGNLTQYIGDAPTRSAELTTSKYLWNSTISTEGGNTCVWMSHFFTLAPPWNIMNTCASPSNSP
jgi:hypothetical protein